MRRRFLLNRSTANGVGVLVLWLILVLGCESDNRRADNSAKSFATPTPSPSATASPAKAKGLIEKPNMARNVNAGGNRNGSTALPTAKEGDSPTLPVVSGRASSRSSGSKSQGPIRSTTVPSGATARCRDGTYSFSQNRRGTCSHHGGMALILRGVCVCPAENNDGEERTWMLILIC
jgi:hypothetical protein